jgi:hypothetical protein
MLTHLIRAVCVVEKLGLAFLGHDHPPLLPTEVLKLISNCDIGLNVHIDGHGVV